MLRVAGQHRCKGSFQRHDAGSCEWKGQYRYRSGRESDWRDRLRRQGRSQCGMRPEHCLHLEGGELTRAKISIDQPLDMRMEVVDVDENLPAIKMDVGLKIIQFQHEIVYRGAVWFQGEIWSDFISNLEQGDGEANLKDMSDIFSLKLIRGIDTDSLIWKFRKEAVDASVGEAGFMCKSANINPFVEEFLSFYRWWE